MSALLTRPSIKLLIALACVGLGVFLGWHLRDRDYQKHLKQDAQQEAQWVRTVRAFEGEADRIAAEARDAIAQKQAERVVLTRTITKEIPTYVTKTVFADRVDAGGGLPAGLVWVHNQAASGDPAPLPPGVTPDTPTGIGVPELADVVARNYAVCEDRRIENEGWRQLYQSLQAQQEQLKKEDPHGK